MGIPSEELGSWKNSGRRRIWKSGQGNGLPAERQSGVHDCGCKDAERYLSFAWFCHAHLREPQGVDEATRQPGFGQLACCLLKRPPPPLLFLSGCSLGIPTMDDVGWHGPWRSRVRTFLPWKVLEWCYFCTSVG